MKIERNNCEAWFLDYYEGNLSEGQVRELFAFLELHPDLREIFDSYEAVSFDPDQLVKFDAKSDLKKTEEVPAGISGSNYEEYIVGAVEGTLTPEEEKQLENFLAAHPGKREELDLLRKTILEPETGIVFEDKNALKKILLVTEANFDEYAVAYVDGELSGEALLQFENYVAARPDKMQALALYGQAILQPDTSVVFEDKDSLRRKSLVITDENFEETAVASLEGQLNAADEKTFAAFVAADEKRQKMVALYAQTRLQPDTSVVFEDKDSLRRKERGAFFWIRDIRFAAAAAVALLIGLLWWSNSGKVEPAENNSSLASHQDYSAGKNPVNNSGSDPVIVPAPETKQLANAPESRPHVRTVTAKDITPKIRETFAAIGTHEINSLKSRSVRNDVNFSEAYYEGPHYSEPVSARNEAVSIGQYAMRWVKTRLDRDSDGDELGTDPMVKNRDNQNVSTFDLTSSAVNRIGQSTGSNLHLAKSAEGTVLTFGKYDFLLNRNR